MPSIEKDETQGLPYVFIFDWDGTIAGRVDFQVQQFLLHNTLKKYGFKPIKQNPIPPAFFPNAKLIRPGFGSFLKAMRKTYPEAYFFIYTASEKTWAHQEIAWVEKTHNIRFMRPIFTRSDCVIDMSGSYRKAVTKVFPRIIKAISKENGQTYSAKERTRILEDHTIIIDNNAVFTDRPEKMLLCPDYNYAVFENLLHGIPAEARTHPAVQQNILGLVNQGYLCPMPGPNEDAMRSLARQYEWLAIKCKSITQENTFHEHDLFWPYLKKLITRNHLKTFSVSVIKQLQEAVWKHLRKSRTKHPLPTK
jgi:hypothetical protein